MPIFKGIKLTIVSQYELKVHTELPHPDSSSQFTHRATLRDSNVFPQLDPRPATMGESKADKILGREESSISCYIPSLAGARFWLRYSIEEAAAIKSSYYYFKLFMNGRLITSWGTNTKTGSNGQVMRAMFDPSERWNYLHDGIVYKNNGTECRPFFFNNQEAQSPARDGGLIEVRIYRAFGRRRKLPEPTEYKSQNEYGIVMPSGGLLDSPQDAKFYDYHLQDSKEKPFAVFKFHYRSWETLASQELVPSTLPKTMMGPSPSILVLNNGNPQALKPEFLYPFEEIDSSICVDEKDMKDSPLPKSWRSFPVVSPSPSLNLPPEAEGQATTPPARSGIPWMGPPDDYGARANSVFHDGDIPVSKFSQGSPQPPKLYKHRTTGPDSQKALPSVPLRDSADTTFSRRTSTSSRATSTMAPSITPSLLEHTERSTISPEPVIGVATLQTLKARHSVSISSSETMSDQRGSSKTKFIRRKFSKSPQSSIKAMPKSPTKQIPATVSDATLSHSPKNIERTEREEQDRIENSAISLSESEWMCRTPSPGRLGSQHTRVQTFQSPGIESDQTSGNSSDGGHVLRRKAMDWYDSLRRSSSSECSPSSQNRGKGIKVHSGNWI
ncbi:hypothetical protein BJ878DRAFT_31551 [Calycina marina]|uniref:Uncharacterized protein n=1 Tax=Calycina marina TaxID=1763456 RepID=A0A9P8CH80_9HELO|nr:hypothetical protein BJ878DRAFT_31551 [Calycina marina]